MQKTIYEGYAINSTNHKILEFFEGDKFSEVMAIDNLIIIGDDV